MLMFRCEWGQRGLHVLKVGNSKDGTPVEKIYLILYLKNKTLCILQYGRILFIVYESEDSTTFQAQPSSGSLSKGDGQTEGQHIWQNVKRPNAPQTYLGLVADFIDTKNEYWETISPKALGSHFISLSPPGFHRLEKFGP